MKRQKDEGTKRQKNKKKKEKRTKRQKRVTYCDVRAVSHSCDVFLVFPVFAIDSLVFNEPGLRICFPSRRQSLPLSSENRT